MSGRHIPKIQGSVDAWMRYKLRRLKKFGIIIDYLHVLWDKQNGSCRFCGLPFTTRFNDLRSATVDRIDSSRPYSVDNIQLACKFMNLAKGNRPDHELLEWIMEVRSPTRPIIAQVNSWLKLKAYSIRHGDIRMRNKNFDIDLLIGLWEKQQGRCAISGVSMGAGVGNLFAASVDRIDSNIGYVGGNIQLVCRAINIGRCSNSLNEVIEFIAAIRRGIISCGERGQ